MSNHDDMVDAFAYAILSTKPKQPNTLQRFVYWLFSKTTVTQREKIENLVKRIDHLKTSNNPEGNPFQPKSISDEEAIDQIEDLITKGKIEALEKAKKLTISGHGARSLDYGYGFGDAKTQIVTAIDNQISTLQASLKGKS